MAANPLSYKDLFDFSDSGGIKGALRDVKALKDIYKEFIDAVINGNIASITAQQNALADSARQLAAATRDLNVTTTAGQKSLIENAKLMAQLETANRKLAQTQQATNNINNSAASSINALDAKLKEQIALYKQASSATEQDRAAMDRMAASINRTRAEITQMSAAIKTNVNGFNAAKGSYAALDAETRQLVTRLKGLENGLNGDNAAAKALQKQIFDNTQKLKDFDAAMNQNFRNVGNYKSAIGGLTDQFKSYLGGFVSLYAGIALAGKIIKSNAEISDSIADLRRTAQLTAIEAENLSNALKKLDTRTSLKGLLDIAIVGGRLGIAKDNLVDFTAAADKLTQALGSELGNTEEITTGLGKIINIFSDDKNITGDRLLHLGNAIVDLANKGVASGKYIVDFTQRLAGIAGVAKISLGSTIGLGAGLEELGTSAEVGGSAVTQLLFKIGQDVPKYAKLAGKSVEDFANTVKTSPIEALIQLSEGLAKNKKGFAEISESFKDAEAKGVRVAGTLAVIGTNGGFLREKILAANEALLKTNEITDAAALKNDTLGASLEKLDNEFKNYTTSGGIAKFFKFLVDQLRTSISGLNDIIDLVTRIKSFGDLSTGLDTLKKRDEINADYTSSKNTRGNFTSQYLQAGSPLPIVQQVVSELPINDLKAMVIEYSKATQAAANASNKFRAALKSGELNEDQDGDFKKVEDNYKKLQKILDLVSAAYVDAKSKIKKANVDTSAAVAQGSGNDLTSVAGIRKEIARLSKLPGSADPGSDIAQQIEALKQKLKELSGSVKPAKDALEKLEDQVKALNRALNDGLADGRIDASDKAIQRKIADAEKQIKQINDLRYKLQHGDAPALGIKGDPNADFSKTTAQLDSVDRKRNSLINASDFADQAQDIELEYATLNAKLLGEYRDGTKTREQYDAEATQLATDESNRRYFVEKGRIANLLLNETKGSKEYRNLKEQEANLDAKHTQQQIDDALKVEQARLKSIDTIIGYLNKNIQPLTQQLGEGFGTIFSSLTDDLSTFAKAHKLTFEDLASSAAEIANGVTQAFVASSQARIDQLTTERDNDLQSAGNNEAAKKKITDRYNKQIAQEKTKQARAEKAAALFSIAINTAAAVVKALPNIPLSIAIGVLGAIELAFVAAKPIPKYKGGRTGGPGEYAIVNDGRGPEALVKNNRVRFAGGGKETTTWLEPGEKVFTAEKTAQMFSDEAYSNSFVKSLIKGTGVMMNHENGTSAEKLYYLMNGLKLTENEIARGMSKAMSKTPVQQLVFDDKGFNVFNVGRNYKIKEQGERMKMGGNG